MAELRPYPFAALVTRMFRELDACDAIFDLPARKFYAGDPGLDMSTDYMGRRPGTPLGPAAGPQTQMAQNIVLSWLAGSRILELKTVQIRDDLAIPRPCIDMRTVGYNAEWSQELKVAESLDEYVKGMMLVEILKASGRIPEAATFSPVVYDLSLGYDLAGIRSGKVQGFVGGMLDARAVIDRFRKEIPAEFRRYRDLDYPACLSDTMTLSTFHGCPPGEVEGITEFLMRGPGLHCTVKLNPMLLGPLEVSHLLHDTLGYRDILAPASAFERDMKWNEMTEILGRLAKVADETGRGLGVKFSNTLIVENRAGFLPGSEKEVYLSGAPLHVLAMRLVARFREQFGDRFPVSFSAGIDRQNYPDAAALGLVPVTVCSDLLRPGGYGRMKSYHEDLAARMRKAGAATLDDWVIRAFDQGDAALRASGASEAEAAVHAAREALSNGGDLRAAAGENLYPRWVSAARLLNTKVYAEKILADSRYTAARNSRAPRRIGSHLQLFDCISCDKCVPVCPNDANFTFAPDLKEIRSAIAVSEGGAWRWTERDPIRLEEDHQIGNFADFCNDCGNCDVFCPEEGGPYIVKPRFFGSAAAWAADGRDGFHVERTEAGDRARGRFSGHEYAMEWTGGAVVYSGRDFSLRFAEADPAGTLDGSGPAEVDLTYGFIMDRIRRGVLDAGGVNYISMLAAAEGAER